MPNVLGGYDPLLMNQAQQPFAGNYATNVPVDPSLNPRPFVNNYATNIPVAPASAPAQSGGFLSGMNPNQQQALFRSVLEAGNMMQRQADPYGQLPSTRMFSGIAKGLDTYSAIRKEQKMSALNKRRASKLAEIGQEGTPAYKAGRLAGVGFETGDPNLAARGLALQGQLTPSAPKQEGLRTTRPGEGIYNPLTGKTTIPIPKVPALQAIQPGISYIDPATGETVLTGRPKTPTDLGYTVSGGYLIDKATGTVEKIDKTNPLKVYVINGVGYTVNPDYDPVLGETETNPQLIRRTPERKESGIKEQLDFLKSENIISQIIRREILSGRVKKTLDTGGTDIFTGQKILEYDPKVVSEYTAKRRRVLGSKTPEAEQAIQNMEKRGLETLGNLPGIQVPETGGAEGGAITVPPELKEIFDIMRKRTKREDYSDEELLNAIIEEAR